MTDMLSMLARSYTCHNPVDQQLPKGEEQLRPQDSPERSIEGKSPGKKERSKSPIKEFREKIKSNSPYFLTINTSFLRDMQSMNPVQRTIKVDKSLAENVFKEYPQYKKKRQFEEEIPQTQQPQNKHGQKKLHVSPLRARVQNAQNIQPPQRQLKNPSPDKTKSYEHKKKEGQQNSVRKPKLNLDLPDCEEQLPATYPGAIYDPVQNENTTQMEEEEKACLGHRPNKHSRQKSLSKIAGSRNGLTMKPISLHNEPDNPLFNRLMKNQGAGLGEHNSRQQDHSPAAMHYRSRSAQGLDLLDQQKSQQWIFETKYTPVIREKRRQESISSCSPFRANQSQAKKQSKQQLTKDNGLPQMTSATSQKLKVGLGMTGSVTTKAFTYSGKGVKKQLDKSDSMMRTPSQINCSQFTMDSTLIGGRNGDAIDSLNETVRKACIDDQQQEALNLSFTCKQEVPQPVTSKTPVVVKDTWARQQLQKDKAKLGKDYTQFLLSKYHNQKTNKPRTRQPPTSSELVQGCSETLSNNGVQQ